MAVTASFAATSGVLTTIGDSLDNTITTSRNAAGSILINGGAVVVQGGSATVANTSLMQVFGQGGDDVMSLDEANGALPASNMFGGAGNDTVTGGSGADQLFGQGDNDTLLGKGGADFLFGGDGNDTLTGGDGDDQMFGEGGNDRIIWNPGDDTDLAEGGDGTDTLEVNGGNGAESFTITPNGTRVRFDRLTPAPFSIDAGTIENIVLNANGGDDTISASNGLSALVQLTIDGGTGNDTITGGDGNDLLLGGDGNDVVTGGRGNDFALLGAGDDTFVWNPGDGSDTVEGQAGTDTLLFNGANINERVDISANGERVRFFRDIGSVTMDLNEVEVIKFQALGGSDTVTVHDLTGTDVAQVAIDLAAFGGGAGDALADTVVVEGTNAGDTIDVLGQGTSVSIVGLSSVVAITQSEGANDGLAVNALDGNDIVNAGALPAGVTNLTIDAGAGDDRVTGSAGSDRLIGGDGNDIVVGGRGDDLALLGAGDDVFFWAPGDGNDTVEGQDGFDALGFSGANINENIDIAANGGRVRFVRDVANVTMDLDDVERIKFSALGGADFITVNDLSGTDVSEVDIDLQATGGQGLGDGQSDRVSVIGTNGEDVVSVFNAGNIVFAAGLAASVVVLNAEAGLDTLIVSTLAGNDTIDASGLAAGNIILSLSGGAGADLLIGSAGNDSVVGGTGNDVAFLGAGDDVFTWNPGDGSDVLRDSGGFDTLQFNGANINENVDISANGGRGRFFRDAASITMDINEVERVKFGALGGADTITVNDLSGTGIKSVEIDLAATPGGSTGDNQPDRVIVQATNNADQIGVTASDGVVAVNGLSAQVLIDHAEGANDSLTVFGLAGDDLISALLFPAGLLNLTLDGGTGNDSLTDGAGGGTLVGGAGNDFLKGIGGNDILQGGDGDDTLEGGVGDDVIDGGNGNDILSFANAGVAVIVSFSGSLAVPGLGTDIISGIEGLKGGAFADTLGGDAGDNVLDGFLGADILDGKAGNDQYYVDNVGDVVIEAANSGTDRVFASVSYTLGAGQEIEKLTTTDNGGTAAIDLAGNEFSNAIFGNAGSNLLDGKGGADALVGFGGDDLYFADNAGDSVNEAVGGGNDRVFASVSYTLGAGQEIEKLTTTDNGGLTAINLTGNDFANAIFGNAGANTLDGKAGADTLVGFGGDDFFFVDNANDVVIEAVGGGNDRVFASASFALGAGQEIEKLTTADNAGTAAINLTGNGFANAIFGNAGANILDGKGGADTLVGFGGDDFYRVDNAGDVVSETAGGGNDQVFASVDYTLGAGVQVERLSTDATAGFANITLIGNELNNTLIGNAGSNALKGGLGNDVLFGGGGIDAFVFNTALNAVSNVDTIIDFNVADDDIVLSSGVFTAAAPGVLSAGAFFVGAAAHDADDRIVYDSATGALFYDADGIGGTAAIQFAAVSAGLGLTHNDFIVV